MVDRLSKRLVKELFKIELPWTPYKPIEKIVEGLKTLDHIIDYIYMSHPNKETSNVLVGMLKQYSWHFLHWALPRNRYCMDLDMIEFNSNTPLGLVEFGKTSTGLWDLFTKHTEELKKNRLIFKYLPKEEKDFIEVRDHENTFQLKCDLLKALKIWNTMTYPQRTLLNSR